MSGCPMRLGVISALQQEQAGLVDAMTAREKLQRGMREYVTGKLWEIDAVCVLSRMGKVAAAATTATLIERFGVTHILFTGVAGSADKTVRIGDIVIAEALVQHDMDASPLFPRFEIPLTGQKRFSSDLQLTQKVGAAADDFVARGFEQAIAAADREAFQLQQVRVHRGLIASGDEFVHSSARLAELKTHLPDLLAVEMEGAAVAQVCFEFGIPFAVIRTISDSADQHAPLDFVQFIERVAAHYAYGVVSRYCAVRITR